MTRKATGRIILIIILLAAFNVFAFTVPVLRTNGFRVAYVFGNFAILYQLYVVREICSRENADGQRPGLPLARLALYYLVIQLAVSVTQITMAASTSGRLALLINGLLFSFPVIGYITTKTVRRETARQKEKLKKAT